MRERLTDRSAGNWVDRGQPPEPELTRVLASYLGQDPAAPDVHLRKHVDAIRGMVETDRNHARTDEPNISGRPASHRRTAWVG